MKTIHIWMKYDRKSAWPQEKYSLLLIATGWNSSYLLPDHCHKTPLNILLPCATSSLLQDCKLFRARISAGAAPSPKRLCLTSYTEKKSWFGLVQTLTLPDPCLIWGSSMEVTSRLRPSQAVWERLRDRNVHPFTAEHLLFFQPVQRNLKTAPARGGTYICTAGMCFLNCGWALLPLAPSSHLPGCGGSHLVRNLQQVSSPTPCHSAPASFYILTRHRQRFPPGSWFLFYTLGQRLTIINKQ